jgi:hypothetical protein
MAKGLEGSDPRLEGTPTDRDTAEDTSQALPLI